MKRYLNDFRPLFFVIFIASHLTTNSFSQELNEEFINSLPGSLKEDVLNQIKGIEIPSSIKQKDIKNYSAFDSKIKPSLDIELLKDDFSNLKFFGESFFRSFPSSFMPINDPSASDTYILDVDDEISIQLLGSIATSTIHKIERDGSIFINKVGKITLAGLSLDKANILINEKISKTLIEVSAIVTLKTVRDIQVLVTGNSKFPGIYTLGGYSTVLHAISSAGGINEGGTYRNILHKRNGEVIQEIDLYDIFVDGDTSFVKSLKTGDSVIIPPSNNFIRVVGAVNRPAIYEFKSGEMAQDVIRFSGGTSNKSQDGLFYISREDVKTNEVKILSSNNYKNINLIENDKIFVPYKTYHRDNLQLGDENFLTKPIKLEGAVNNPGEYYLGENETLSELIIRAGGYKDNAYPFGGVLLNENALAIEKEYNERLYREAIKSLASVAISYSKNINVSNILPLLTEFKNIQSIGRVKAEFDIFKIELDPIKDTLLTPGDKIYIPYKKNIVHVFGEVLSPGSHSHKTGLTIKDYIDQSGGLNKSADKGSIIIVHANGEAERVRINRNLFGKQSPNVRPGSVIYITRDLNNANSIQFFATISPIVSSLAISLASLNTINNN